MRKKTVPAPAAAPARVTLETLQAEFAGDSPDAAALVAHAHRNAVESIRRAVRPGTDPGGGDTAHAFDQAVRLLVGFMLATGNGAVRTFDDLPATVRYLLHPFRG